MSGSFVDITCLQIENPVATPDAIAALRPGKRFNSSKNVNFWPPRAILSYEPARAYSVVEDFSISQRYGENTVIKTSTKAGYFFAALVCLAVPLGLAQYSYICATAALPFFAAILAGYFCRHSAATINKLWSHWLDEAKNERREWQQMLARHVPVLPVLAGQLRATVEQVEQVQTLAQELAEAARVMQFSNAVRERLNSVARTLVATEKALYTDLAGMSLPGDQRMPSNSEASIAINEVGTSVEAQDIFPPNIDPAARERELLDREV